MNVIVAGANGFIGINLVNNLLKRGYKVTTIDTCFSDKLKESTRCISIKNRDINQLVDELTEEYFCFFDLAWVGTSGALRTDYNIQLRNVQLTCEYVKLASLIKCQKFVYASSINEMETYEYLQSDSIEPSGGYIYGTGKLAAHLMGEIVAFQYQIDFIPIIITKIYGAGEKSARLIYTSILKLLKGERCSFTSGYQNYDFIYISDAINSIIEIAKKGKGFHRYYLGSGEPKPLREFLLIMRNIVAPGAEIGLGDLAFKGSNINYEQFDMKKVERDTGYKNKVSFEEGISMTAEYIRKEEGL